VIANLNDYFAPQQLGAGLLGGCEAAVHATRHFIQSTSRSSVVVKLDFSNAFNSIHRDTMLEAVHRKIPEIYRYIHLSYGSPSFSFLVTMSSYLRKVRNKATHLVLSFSV
ncbi:MAG TPA: hypothetical protein VLS45_06925, partial [Methylomicrobium sp.]|nr:hypothetical protein [Methylomicrobium sp.]